MKRKREKKDEKGKDGRVGAVINKKKGKANGRRDRFLYVNAYLFANTHSRTHPVYDDLAVLLAKLPIPKGFQPAIV